MISIDGLPSGQNGAVRSHVVAEAVDLLPACRHLSFTVKVILALVNVDKAGLHLTVSSEIVAAAIDLRRTDGKASVFIKMVDGTIDVREACYRDTVLVVIFLLIDLGPAIQYFVRNACCFHSHQRFGSAVRQDLSLCKAAALRVLQSAQRGILFFVPVRRFRI